VIVFTRGNFLIILEIDMKKLGLLSIAAFIVLTSSAASAQTIVAHNTSARLTKITQIALSGAAATPNFIIKGVRATTAGVVTNTFTIRGKVLNDLHRDCLDLASKLNLNALSSPSALTVGMAVSSETAGQVSGGPVIQEYFDANIKSCTLTSN
jgi:hypothetical protein